MRTMPVMLQVRNLPDEVHARLKERAARERMSLSDYVAQELTRHVEYRSNREIIEEFRRNHPDLRLSRDQVVEGIHADRQEREENLERIAVEHGSDQSPVS